MEYMEYINIISKEPIMTATNWTLIVNLLIPIGILVFPPLVTWHLTLDDSKTLRSTVVSSVISIITTVILCITLNIFFQVPTGRYKYEATVNKVNITVEQYEEFIEEYNPTIEDGIYYWEE